MWFRNLCWFVLTDPMRPDSEVWEAALTERPLREPGSMERDAKGFVSPLGGPEGARTHGASGALLVRLGLKERLLPGAVVAEEVQRRIQRAEQEEGRAVGRRERARLKDEVLTELLPQAFVRTAHLDAYLDSEAGLLCVDSGSRSKAETMASELRSTLGSLPLAAPADPAGLRTILTAWLASQQPPAGFVLGDEVELKDPSTGSIARCRKQELDASEVQAHLDSGKQVTQLALVYDERISFVVNEKSELKKLRFLDVVQEQLPDGGLELAAEMDARFSLMVLELRAMLAQLRAALQPLA